MLFARLSYPLFFWMSNVVMQPLVTDAQLERYFGVYGIVSFSDHNNDGIEDQLVRDDCKTYATAYIVGVLSQRFEYAKLATSPIIPELCAVITLRELCLRRGNAPPASLEARYQEIVAERGLLDRIASGKIPLVDTNGNRIEQRAGFAPTHANLQIDRRFVETKVRVVDSSSNMQPTPLKRNVDRWRVQE